MFRAAESQGPRVTEAWYTRFAVPRTALLSVKIGGQAHEAFHDGMARGAPRLSCDLIGLPSVVLSIPGVWQIPDLRASRRNG